MEKLNMTPHQQRVIDEQAELNEKLTKLYSFLETSLFNSLDENEKGRLKRQSVIMQSYFDILGERISAF